MDSCDLIESARDKDENLEITHRLHNLFTIHVPLAKSPVTISTYANIIFVGSVAWDTVIIIICKVILCWMQPYQ